MTYQETRDRLEQRTAGIPNRPLMAALLDNLAFLEFKLEESRAALEGVPVVSTDYESGETRSQQAYAGYTQLLTRYSDVLRRVIDLTPDADEEEDSQFKQFEEQHRAALNGAGDKLEEVNK